MLILLPNAIDGLKSLIENFDFNRLEKIDAQLKSEMIQLTVPKFRVDSTSRAEKSLLKSGLTKIFTTDADFSRIMKNEKIHLEELVQHVSFRVDEGASSENFLTATSGLRTLETDRIVSINRPFIYFVRDLTNNVILIAGKLCNPPIIVDQEEMD